MGHKTYSSVLVGKQSVQSDELLLIMPMFPDWIASTQRATIPVGMVLQSSTIVDLVPIVSWALFHRFYFQNCRGRDVESFWGRIVFLGTETQPHNVYNTMVV